VGGLPRTEAGGIDYSKDFFSRPAYLTVSGQLNGEYYASALSNVYTFGPTFRAENSHTARHLAEFWMIEPEMAFCDLADDMACAEDYVRFCCSYLLQHCRCATACCSCSAAAACYCCLLLCRVGLERA
jgi:asparaginyl-tRNA synthetase